MRFHAWTGRQHAFSGESSENEWVGGVGVRGPVAGVPRLDVLVDLQVGALPETPLDLTDPDTWGRAADLRLSLARRLSRETRTGQEVTVELVGSWGFYTALEARARDRYSRALGAGFRLTESRSGAFIEVLAGRFQPCGPPGRGQLLLRGLFPLTRGGPVRLALVGDAGLNIDPPAESTDRRDVFRLAVAVAR